MSTLPFARSTPPPFLPKSIASIPPAGVYNQIIHRVGRYLRDTGSDKTLLNLFQVSKEWRDGLWDLRKEMSQEYAFVIDGDCGGSPARWEWREWDDLKYTGVVLGVSHLTIARIYPLTFSTLSRSLFDDIAHFRNLENLHIVDKWPDWDHRDCPGDVIFPNLRKLKLTFPERFRGNRQDFFGRKSIYCFDQAWFKPNQVMPQLEVVEVIVDERIILVNGKSFSDVIKVIQKTFASWTSDLLVWFRRIEDEDEREHWQNLVPNDENDSLEAHPVVIPTDPMHQIAGSRIRISLDVVYATETEDGGWDKSVVIVRDVAEGWGLVANQETGLRVLKTALQWRHRIRDVPYRSMTVNVSPSSLDDNYSAPITLSSLLPTRKRLEEWLHDHLNNKLQHGKNSIDFAYTCVFSGQEGSDGDEVILWNWEARGGIGQKVQTRRMSYSTIGYGVNVIGEGEGRSELWERVDESDIRPQPGEIRRAVRPWWKVIRQAVKAVLESVV